MQDQWQWGYPTLKAREHWEFRGLHLRNNSVFLVRELFHHHPELSWGLWQGRLKTWAKITQQSYAPSPKGLARARGVGWLCFPCSWEVWKSPSSHRAPAAETKGHRCRDGSPSAALCHGHWFRQTNSARESPLCWLTAVERSKNLSDFLS